MSALCSTRYQSILYKTTVIIKEMSGTEQSPERNP